MSLHSSLKTLLSDETIEIERIKKSRFITYAFSLSNHRIPNQPDSTLCKELLEHIHTLHPNASHVVWAYKGLPHEEGKWSDDGEPSGSGGQPILNVIEGLELSYVLVGVVRYYGGTQLGKGGLARAYSQAAQACLKEAGTETLIPRVDLTLTFGYDLEPRIHYLLPTYQSWIIDRTYHHQVSFVISSPQEQAPVLKDLLVEYSAGNLVWDISNPYYGLTQPSDHQHP